MHKRSESEKYKNTKHTNYSQHTQNKTFFNYDKKFLNLSNYHNNF